MPVTQKSILIEVGEEAAGVLIESGRDFIFHPVHARLMHLHGKHFTSVQAAQIAAREGIRQLAHAS